MTLQTSLDMQQKDGQIAASHGFESIPMGEPVLTECHWPAGGAGGLPAGLTLEISRDGTAYAGFPQTYELGTDECLVFVRATVPAGTVVSTAHNGSFHLKVSWECDNGAFFNMPNASKLVLLKGGRIVIKWQDHGLNDLVLTNGMVSDEFQSNHEPGYFYFINQGLLNPGEWRMQGANSHTESRVGILDDFGVSGHITNEGANTVGLQEDYQNCQRRTKIWPRGGAKSGHLAA